MQPPSTRSCMHLISCEEDFINKNSYNLSHIGEIKLLFAVYNKESSNLSTSSSVTRACDPCGDYKLMGRWVDLIGAGFGLGFILGLPIPSWESRHGSRAKARELCFLEWGRL
ncbi:unnamed protein product, partial [Brassica oleracea]